MNGYINRNPSIERGVGNVLVEERLEHNDLVAWFKERELECVNPFVGSSSDNNLRIRVQFALE